MKVRSRAQRLKAPAYAKALLDNRRRGFHPLTVDVIYGDDWLLARDRALKEQAQFVREGKAARPYSAAWIAGIGNPMLALRPRDYAPKVFDFHCVAGLEVRVFDLVGAASDCDVDEMSGVVTRWGLFYDVLSELAAYAADVVFHEGLEGAPVALSECAWQSRAVDAESRKMVWPRWWSDALDARLRSAESGLLADRVAVLSGQVAAQRAQSAAAHD